LVNCKTANQLQLLICCEWWGEGAKGPWVGLHVFIALAGTNSFVLHLVN